MTMSLNHKLTNVVKDRVVEHFLLNASELLISFVDGSTMTVTIAECNARSQRIRQSFCLSVKTTVRST
jgi:hypothetical protein